MRVLSQNMFLFPGRECHLVDNSLAKEMWPLIFENSSSEEEAEAWCCWKIKQPSDLSYSIKKSQLKSL